MTNGRALSITTSAECLDGEHPVKLPPGHYVRLVVADTGVGMDASTAARAVEPLFSTKGVGRGTGLGLSMVHGLAAQLGGGLIINSRPGRGTSVELWLPVAADVISARVSGTDMEASMAAGTALVLDDEALVRACTAEMLSDLGYSIVEAASGEQALELFDSGVPFDVLVTDHLMPGLSGTELARLVRARRPSVRVLVVSGYADVDGITPDLPRLAKPFRRGDLASAVMELGEPAIS